MKPKAGWQAIDSPKKQTNQFGEISISNFKYFQIVMAKKPNSFVHFLGESVACQSAFGFI